SGEGRRGCGQRDGEREGQSFDHDDLLGRMVGKNLLRGGVHEGLFSQALEMRDQRLARGHQTPVLDETRSDAALDALDKRPVLAADLVVELEQLIDPFLVDVRGEEVVEEPSRPLGATWQDRPAGQIGPAGKDVDAEVWPDEVELAARDL